MKLINSKFYILDSNQGISLTEVLIVMVVTASLLIASYLAFHGQIGKGRDAKRRDDLERIRVAFEDYFNDTGCYPSSTVLENCDSSDFEPYLNSIPCDPETNEPYLIFVQQTVCPSWYLVLTEMEYISGLSNPCQGGCNFENEEEAYYYYITSGNVSPWEIDQFTGFGESTGECPVEEIGCFEIDSKGNCNSSEHCTISEDCFSDDYCTADCRIESCN